MDTFKFEISGDYLLYNNKHSKVSHSDPHRAAFESAPQALAQPFKTMWFPGLGSCSA